MVGLLTVGILSLHSGCREQNLALVLLWTKIGIGRGVDRNSMIRN